MNTFTEFQDKYPNLKYFTYDNINGNLSLMGYNVRISLDDLNKVNPLVFAFLPQDIYLYLANRFYLDNGDVIDKEKSILKQLSSMEVSEQEKNWAKTRDTARKHIVLNSVKNLLSEHPTDTFLLAFYDSTSKGGRSNSLVRINGNIPRANEDDEPFLGYTNTVLIIIITIVTGVLLAFKLVP